MAEKWDCFYTLISGATGGVGRAFVWACAAEGGLFLTGRSEEKLAALKGEILAKYPDCRVLYCPCDLTDESSRRTMYAYIKERGYAIYPGKVTDADTFRIGVIGEIYQENIQRLTEIMKSYMDTVKER